MTLNDAKKPLPNLDPVPCRLIFINISEEDVKDCLFNFESQPGKSPRLNQSTFTERMCYRSCHPVFRYFRSLTPPGSDWENVNVSPIHKKDEMS